jgi:hypothetical protein
MSNIEILKDCQNIYVIDRVADAGVLIWQLDGKWVAAEGRDWTCTDPLNGRQFTFNSEEDAIAKCTTILRNRIAIKQEVAA